MLVQRGEAPGDAIDVIQPHAAGLRAAALQPSAETVQKLLLAVADFAGIGGDIGIAHADWGLHSA